MLTLTMMRHFTMLSLLATACGTTTSTPPPTLQGYHDMATPSQPQRAGYCGDGMKSRLWEADCTVRCVPDEQVWNVCTSGLGRVVYTRQSLRTVQVYAYTLELGSSKCDDVAVRVWSLSSIVPIDAAAGRESYDTVESDCSKQPKPLTTFFGMNMDRLYYLPVVEVTP